MKTKFISVAAIALVAIVGAACGSGATDADDLNNRPTGGTSANGGSAPAQGGSGLASGLVTGSSGAVGSGGSAPTGSGGTGASPGGSPGTGGSILTGTGGSVSSETGGGGGTVTNGGSISTGGSTQPTGGGGGDAPATGGTSAGGTVNGGSGGEVATGPYAPRTGSFKMLVYSQVIGGAFPHPSIPAGRRMLQSIGQKQGFEVVLATDESEINPTGLAKYEIVFFLNSTGEIFNSGSQRADYETWIKDNGAYAGMHGATDSANSWQFYKEITGQYYDQHDNVISGTVQWTDDGLNHVAGRRDLPNPWNRREEWYKFNTWQNWSTRPGFTILNTVTTTGGGTRPVSYVREWSNFRAFYTSLGHEDAPYTDPEVIKHVAAGIMWAVRREALIVP
jgi:type 1 glutamine amidotransferase